MLQRHVLAFVSLDARPREFRFQRLEGEPADAHVYKGAPHYTRFLSVFYVDVLQSQREVRRLYAGRREERDQIAGRGGRPRDGSAGVDTRLSVVDDRNEDPEGVRGREPPVQTRFLPAHPVPVVGHHEAVAVGRPSTPGNVG